MSFSLRRLISFRIVAGLCLLIWLPLRGAAAQDDVETCLSCHEDDELTGLNAAGDEISVFVSLEAFGASVHGEMECVDCHQDLAGVEDYPHDEDLARVDCSLCHDDMAEILGSSVHGGEAARCQDCHGSHAIVSPGDSEVGANGIDCSKCHAKISRQYALSLHGQEVTRGAELAPRCWDCHGAHDIVGAHSPEARVARFNIPYMCGSCHKEGTEVTQRYDIPEDSILIHYSQSIHGVGLFQQGLMVTAVCIDCHTAHNVRSHTDPKSSIYRDNVAGTCQQCHGLIEKVHKKVIRGELWQKEPHKVPVCVDCHSPHRIRRVSYEEGISDKECLTCHTDPSLKMTRNGETISLYIDTLEVHGSIHRGTTCAQCHIGAMPGHNRPCETVAPQVDCSICHSQMQLDYMSGSHGRLADRGDPSAPSCTDCHGKHGVLKHTDPEAPTYPTKIPALCGKCHRHGTAVAQRTQRENAFDEYVMSIHGKGLLESGLIVTAVCSDCHRAHKVLPEEDPESSINHANVAETCAQCHKGILEEFEKSVHCYRNNPTDKPLPGCNDCHRPHTVMRTDQDGFKSQIVDQCGRCHADVTESYFETFHGKVSKLGYAAAAKCHDCHGAHNILSIDNPHSSLSRQNIVQTCGQCHEGSHRRFAGYLTHATHHDRARYPILYWTFWFMTTLLVTTLIVAGVHTIMWLPRSFQMMKHTRELRKAAKGRYEYRRFKRLHSIQHVMVVVSFLGLALTGMTLKFSYLGWAQWLSGMLGGFDSAGYIHRICAVITFGYFGIHIVDLIRQKRRQRVTWLQMLWKSKSMLPDRNDWIELKGTLKWFMGMGPRPAYGRWTYWEKFDYFAVFWGVAVIGLTGLMLWFPELFTRVLPGWIINVATIVHSDEALLATAFIFTVHFFNTHFRPDKFPMDTVIFTGRVPLEELKEDRPGEYQELMQSRDIRKHLARPLHPAVIRSIRVFGALALLIGLALVLLIIYAEIFAYR
ncbi:MAG: hypothetical protein ABIE70_03365 [bacterium]